MTDNPTPPQSDEDPFEQVGWWCWRGDNHGHLATTACRSDNVPIHVPAEWADEMRAVIQRIEDGDDEQSAAPAVSSPLPDQTLRDRIRALHQPVAGEGDTKWCQVCSQEERQPDPVGWWVPWPCPTVQAVDDTPPAADRATVLLEAAEVSARFVSDCQTCAVELEVARELRRLAAEAPKGSEVERLQEQLEESENTAEQLVRNVQTVARERESYRKAWKAEQQRRAKTVAEVRKVAEGLEGDAAAPGVVEIVRPALRDAARQIRAALDGAAPQQPDTRPRRGDQFEAWLKAQRDAFGWQGANRRDMFDAFDNLLDLYRLHADTGTPLGEHVCEGRAVGDCECLGPAVPVQPAAEAPWPHTMLGAAEAEEKPDLNITPLPVEALVADEAVEQPAADGSSEEAQFGMPGCTCKPWTSEGGKRRFMEPGETVDRVSGWHILATCPHHGGEEAGA